MKNLNWKWKGLKIGNFNTLMILLSCVLYLCLQGYYYSRPVPADIFEVMLKEN